MSVPTLDRPSGITLPEAPPANSDAAVHGEWHPHSRDLAAELPPLLEAAWAAGYDTFRVIFSIGAWDDTPRQLTVDDRRVKCGGFRFQDANEVDLLDAWGRHRLTLTVVR